MTLLASTGSSSGRPRRRDRTERYRREARRPAPSASERHGDDVPFADDGARRASARGGRRRRRRRRSGTRDGGDGQAGRRVVDVGQVVVDGKLRRRRRSRRRGRAGSSRPSPAASGR